MILFRIVSNTGRGRQRRLQPLMVLMALFLLLSASSASGSSLVTACDTPALLARATNVTCTDNPSAANASSSVVRVLNGCLRDNTQLGLGRAAGLQFSAWFSAHELLLGAALAVAILPFFAFWSDVTSETAARANLVRMHTARLLFRVAYAVGTATWLQFALLQAAPCVCTADGATLPSVAHPTMPAADVAGVTVLAGHVAERVSAPFGVALPLLAAAAAVATGAASLGQALAGVLLGGVLHAYQTRTPGYARIAECALGVVGALATAFLRKSHDASVDVSNLSQFFAALVWQLAALLLPLLWFDTQLARETLRKSVAALHAVDFLFYVPLGDSINVRYDLTEPEPKNSLMSRVVSERRLASTLSVLVAILVSLAAVRASEPHINDWFSIGSA